MSNDEFLRTLMEKFPELKEPQAYGGVFLFLGIIFGILAILFLVGVIYNIIDNLPLWGISDFPIGHTVAFIIATVITIVNFGSVADAVKAYKIDYEAYLDKQETYKVDEAKFNQEQEALYEQRKMYTIYLDGTKVDYNTVLICQYNYQIIDEEQTIYLTHK